MSNRNVLAVDEVKKRALVIAVPERIFPNYCVSFFLILVSSSNHWKVRLIASLNVSYATHLLTFFFSAHCTSERFQYVERVAVGVVENKKETVAKCLILTRSNDGRATTIWIFYVEPGSLDSAVFVLYKISEKHKMGLDLTCSRDANSIISTKLPRHCWTIKVQQSFILKRELSFILKRFYTRYFSRNVVGAVVRYFFLRMDKRPHLIFSVRDVICFVNVWLP